MGTMVHRMVVITAAVCVCNPRSTVPDLRPINIVGGTGYRHPRRGIRVQITQILIPKSKLTIFSFPEAICVCVKFVGT